MAHVQDENINIKAKLQKCNCINAKLNNFNSLNANLQSPESLQTNVIERGLQGIPGEAATIQLGTVTTGTPGSDVIITNSGNENAAVFNFTIPQGEKGEQGDPGTPGSYTFSTGLTQNDDTISVTDYAKLLKNKATGTGSLTIDGNAAWHNSSVNIGEASSASNSNATAVGFSSSAALRGTAIGNEAVSSAQNAIQIGKGTNSTATTLAIGFNGTNYQLLDGTTGLIPDARISTNIARTVDIPTDYVTTNTAQTISGSKAFSQPLVIADNNGLASGTILSNKKILQRTSGDNTLTLNNKDNKLRLVGSETRPKYSNDGSTFGDLALYSDIPTNYVPTSRTINSYPLSADITLSYSDVGALSSSTTISDLTTTAQQNALNSGATTTNIGQIATNTSDISTINGLIPSQATTSNQLADKAFVNSSVQTATANFRGNWDDWADVPSVATDYPADYAGSKTPTVNDYLVVQDASDYTLDTLTGTWRFKYSGTWADDGKSGWLPEYQVNETPLTAAQLDALNSGITAADVTLIETALQPNDNVSSLVNDAGYITSINSSDVVTALGYTPYNSSNPNGYTSNVGTVVSVNNTSPDGNGNVSLSIPTALSDLTVSAGSNITISGDTISATDTTYSNFVGCDSITAGSAGLVPAPSAGDQDKYLKADGTWGTVSGGGSSTLSGLSDVNITSIADGQLIKYDNNSSKWINFTPSYISSIPSSYLQNQTSLGLAINRGNAVVPQGGLGSITLGTNSQAGGSYSIAIGNNSQVDISADYAIQIGAGTNSTPSTLNVGFNANNYQLLTSAGKIPNARLNLDTLPASGSGNAITSGAVYTALSNKQDTSTAVTHTASTAVGDSDTPVYIDSDGTATSTGKSIASTRFDGQWVNSRSQLTTVTAIGTYTLSLSSYLPNDNYDYLVHVAVSGYLTTSGKNSDQYISSDIYTIAEPVTEPSAAYTRDWHSHLYIPVGTGRKFTYQIATYALTSGDVTVYGYRRLGTNT